MPENPSRFAAALYDQFEDEHPVADWGGDELFTRMPRPRAVDDAPAPRFRPSLTASRPSPRPLESSYPAPASALALADSPADRRGVAVGDEWSGPRERRGGAGTAGALSLVRPQRPGLSVVEGAAAYRWDDSGALVEQDRAGRRTTVITGHPGGALRPLPTVPVARRRPARTPAEWIGCRPERIVAWAVVLGLVLILIAISTADAATL